MKYSIDTYRLYESESLIYSAMRMVVKMTEDIDVEILKRSVNKSIKRYPYLAVKAIVDEEGSYVLIPNKNEIAVLPSTGKTPKYSSKEVNEHFCFVEYEDKTIYFNMSHSICSGAAMQQWILTNVYQYVKDKYCIEPDSPGIRKPEDDLFPDEVSEPSLEMLDKEPPIYESKSKDPIMMMKDYLNGLLNPFKRDPVYYVFEFSQKAIIDFARKNDASVVSLFTVAIARMLNKVLPQKYPVIGGEISHNPAGDIGIPHSHCDMHSQMYIDYEREMLDWEMEKLGTMTRGQIILQKDATISHDRVRKLVSFYEKIDQIKGLKNKRKFMKNGPRRSKGARHSTFVCNYIGQADWGEVANYVDEYYLIVDGHLVFEITSLSDRIFLSMMQLINTDKYVAPLKDVFDELEIPYKFEGPLPKNISQHQLPDK